MVDQVLSPWHKAQKVLEQTLLEIAEFFPLTDNDRSLIEFGYNTYRTRRLKGEGRQQITVGRCVDGKIYYGTHTEAEEEEAKSDPDAQFTSSWVDALQQAGCNEVHPNRIVDVVTQRWTDDECKLAIVPPDSIARQQYIQFSPGVNFIVMFKGNLVKLPIEALYPWDYCIRPLPPALEQLRPTWPFRDEVMACIKRMVIQVSNLFPLTAEDQLLIDQAMLEIRKRYAYGYWQLAAAFETDVPGHSKTGVQHDTKSGKANTDAEQAAIKKARHFFPGERMKTIVTAHHSSKNFVHSDEKNGCIMLVTSCALCRKSLLRYSPDILNIIPLNGEGTGKVPLRILYPLPDFVLPELSLTA